MTSHYDTVWKAGIQALNMLLKKVWDLDPGLRRDDALWFETHMHLMDAKFDSDRDEVIQRAFSRNVSTLVEIADGPDEWEKAKNLSIQYRGKIFWTCGLHPYYADQGTAENFQKLKSHLSDPACLALGEVGLDYFKGTIDKKTQKSAFIKSIEISLSESKPLVVHCREAFDDLIPILSSYFGSSRSPKPANPGVIHCFSGNQEQASQCIELGFFLGVDGPVTYPNAKDLREALKGVSVEKLVLETDSPYLPPQGYRGQRNEPSYLPLIGQNLAQFKEMEPLAFVKLMTKNSQILYRLNSL